MIVYIKIISFRKQFRFSYKFGLQEPATFAGSSNPISCSHFLYRLKMCKFIYQMFVFVGLTSFLIYKCFSHIELFLSFYYKQLRSEILGARFIFSSFLKGGDGVYMFCLLYMFFNMLKTYVLWVCAWFVKLVNFVNSDLIFIKRWSPHPLCFILHIWVGSSGIFPRLFSLLLLLIY